MKLIFREHIEQFTRGENPFKSLSIGKKAIIKNWFKTWAPDVDYEIDDDLNIHVKGYLNFSFDNITSLPNNLYVEESLDLYKSNITSLPDNLHVKGFLDLRKTKITSLPDDLYVGRYLDLRKTKITSLPDDLYVGGVIHKDF